MDPLSSVMLRAALVWLLAGLATGAAMLTDRALRGSGGCGWRRVTRICSFVGWFLQFAVGVAYWLMPRRRSAERPLGYGERTAALAVVALNLGLVLRIVAEPVERTGGESPRRWLCSAPPRCCNWQRLWFSWPSCGLVLVLARYARRESKQRDRSRSGIER